MPTKRARRVAMAYVTAPDRTTARQIARTILEARLAACANLLPAESFYRWEGRIEHADEIVVVFKTRPALVRRLLAAVSDAHPYDVPCAVAYEAVGALPAYAAWIEASTSGQA